MQRLRVYLIIIPASLFDKFNLALTIRQIEVLNILTGNLMTLDIVLSPLLHIASI